ncbi:NAD-dependent succinate-semialdehyde dehydrogenase [Bradyrhizobium tropiciagri]|uniref:NAD-dependent succinate-semialdehyde dehydrogenase n=1 Tax=Bradyrhizobium tropiciagri TaxID=312253 RepID=UPI001BA76B98|nr:NAD-dependent succinate-semialdehyde dehydrogenase [Bradyrhizobium tropiciagri]MBR0896739.1 NAD-dependent succinate-semialdehyde dehydrogenase [Bradyrhizobium tropiciagri]
MIYRDIYLFVDGERIGPRDRETRPVLNPATGEEIGLVPLATGADLDKAVASAQVGFETWRVVPAIERAAIIREASDILRDRIDAVARLMTLEEGKPIGDAKLEVAAACDALLWSAEECKRIYGRVIPARSRTTRNIVLREPIGPVAVFTPWNFPASMPARKIAPALAAGCACIIKAAEETPASCLAIIEALLDAGLPPRAINAVFGEPSAVSQHLIRAPEIRKISFTGSVPVGKEIAQLAALGVKPATLELGGHAPVLVLSDADAETVASQAVAAKFRNAGQICTSPTRFYVHDSIYESFLGKFAARARELRVGTGLDSDSEMGPVANPRRLQAMKDLVADAVQAGARLVTGGNQIGNVGFFYAPTILADVPPSAAVSTVEPFGPIAIVNRFSSETEAIKLANQLPFGLAAYVFTSPGKLGASLVDRVECGLLGINTFAVSYAETPFGGVKESGYGSEGGLEGVEAYLTTKFVALA